MKLELRTFGLNFISVSNCRLLGLRAKLTKLFFTKTFRLDLMEGQSALFRPLWIYADGSRRKLKVVAGVYTNEFKIAINCSLSNDLQVEISIIKPAANWLRSHRISNMDTCFCADSKNVIMWWTFFNATTKSQHSPWIGYGDIVLQISWYRDDAVGIFCHIPLTPCGQLINYDFNDLSQVTWFNKLSCLTERSICPH